MSSNYFSKPSHYFVIWLLVSLLVIIGSGCVNSRGKTNQPETKLPPKNSRNKPTLVRPVVETEAKTAIEAHTPKWVYHLDQIEHLRKTMGKNFIVDGFGPFILVSNLKSAQLEDIKKNIISVSYNAFYKDYFKEPPQYVTTIYLFKNREDYFHYSRRYFNETPNTPYGYYRSTEHVILINIASGTGALVHEMSHALMESEFPAVPTWFNEGFASLFEQSRIENGSLFGLNNWRYSILKQAINTNNTVPLNALLRTTNDQFYDDKDGYNYAEARYICYYLQEKGLLKSFYARFKEQCQQDPSGIKILEDLLKKDLAAFEKEWVDWAKGNNAENRDLSSINP